MVEEGVIVNNLIWKISCHLFGGMKRDHYLCIDNVREMSGWGNNTSWSVDSHVRGRVRPLRPAFIIYKAYQINIPMLIGM